MAEGRMSWNGHETWYDGRRRSRRRPDAGRHLPRRAGRRARLHRADRRAPRGTGAGCVLYDQLGCGKSTHLPDAPADFWTPQLFKDELVELTRHLGIADRYAVVGQSWGGMLAMEHALDHPSGLRAIVVADSPASMPLWVSEANRLREDLPPDVQETLDAARGGRDDRRPGVRGRRCASSTTGTSAACRGRTASTRSFAQMAADPTVYHTMNGPSEFHCIGSLKTWDITDRLPEITTPTLLVSGRYDEATPHIVEQIHSRIPGRSGSSSRSRATCRTSRSRRRSSCGWRRSSRRSTERVVSAGARSPFYRRTVEGALTGGVAQVPSDPPTGKRMRARNEDAGSLLTRSCGRGARRSAASSRTWTCPLRRRGSD